MVKFEYFFGVYILQGLLRRSDNLAKILQSLKLTGREGQKLANLTVKALMSDTLLYAQILYSII